MPGTLYLRSLSPLLLFLIFGLLLFHQPFKQLHLLPSVQQDYNLQLPSPPSHPSHVKRDQELLDRFGCLVTKGTFYFEEGIVKATNRFSDPPPDFGDDPFGDNGWSIVEDDDDISEIWDPVFEDIPPREPTQDEYSLVKLDQIMDFANDYDDNNRATNAAYHGYYIPISNTIIMTITYSPQHYVRGRGVEDDEVKEYIPRLNQVSDVAWEVWTAITNSPQKLRFYAVDGIFNTITSPVMDYLFQRDRPGALNVPWDRRLTYGLDSDEGKMLLATPTGIAVAWILIHHKQLLGRRDPRVSIFRDGNLRCMIWELIPVGEKSSFDDYVSKWPHG
ncbi:MAG: hypothetical protein Q9166_005508 [cf. Caloplaca sp. 2 TL-2023]